jgi:hypothetical protein
VPVLVLAVKGHSSLFAHPKASAPPPQDISPAKRQLLAVRKRGPRCRSWTPAASGRHPLAIAGDGGHAPVVAVLVPAVELAAGENAVMSSHPSTLPSSCLPSLSSKSTEKCRFPAGSLLLYRRIYVLEQWLRRIALATLMRRYATRWRSAIPTDISKRGEALAPSSGRRPQRTEVDSRGLSAPGSRRRSGGTRNLELRPRERSRAGIASERKARRLRRPPWL